ncbi:MAG: hypothetical protein JOZ24_05630 [Candidatus Eremiobacteraeota bacterium]|nr:hypothetical protein [Candidatus Eremiobacteraeota bacterium]
MRRAYERREERRRRRAQAVVDSLRIPMSPDEIEIISAVADRMAKPEGELIRVDFGNRRRADQAC